jgi:hypothetical protein
VLVLALAGCAEAGSPQVPVDAPVTKPADAARAMPPPDAATLACTTTATCMTATSLGQINGDDGGTVSASGTQAAWFSVRANEDDSGAFADPMRVLTQLTSPSAAEMFDLFVYINTGTDALECTTPNGTATASGTSESLEVKWGETGTFANGADDSRTVSIEIRPKMGITCSPTAMWQLTVIGGQ